MSRTRYVRDAKGQFASSNVGKRATTVGEDGKGKRQSERAARRKKLFQKVGGVKTIKRSLRSRKGNRVVTKAERLATARAKAKLRGKGRRN